MNRCLPRTRRSQESDLSRALRLELAQSRREELEGAMDLVRRIERLLEAGIEVPLDLLNDVMRNVAAAAEHLPPPRRSEFLRCALEMMEKNNPPTASV
jgi:hypothetical protein